MPLFVGVDPVIAQIFMIVLVLEERRSDVDDRHGVRDGDLEDFDIVSLVPVRDELDVITHPLLDILGGQIA